MQKGIITVVGKDQVGIIAKVCSFLAENKLISWIFLKLSFKVILT